MSRRTNRATAPSQRTAKLTQDAAKRYTTSHWGLEPTVIYDWDDSPDPDMKLTEMGKLVELTFALEWEEGDDPEEVEEVGVIDGFANRRGKNPDILCFSPRVDERLYLALSAATKERFRATWWLRKHPTYWLQDIADEVGGRQARFPHHEIRVQPIGRCVSCAYWTHKLEDPPDSEYEHTMGEWGGIPPMVCIDRSGGLWFAGGSYTVPDEGITQ